MEVTSSSLGPLRGSACSTASSTCSCCPAVLTGLSLQVLGGLEARGGPVGQAVPWAGWEAEVATGEASPPEDHEDPEETPLEAACSTVPGTGSAPIRKYPLPSLHRNTFLSQAVALRGCGTAVLHLSTGGAVLAEALAKTCRSFS